MVELLNLIGLAFAVIGFGILSRQLWKTPDERSFWPIGGGLDRTGISLTFIGFVLQAIGATIALFYSPPC
jgi:hypothetical protein